MNTPDDPNAPADRTASDEFREGLTHLFAAARKVASKVEPQVSRSLEDAEDALQRLGREGEVAVGEVSREVATFAARLADKLREVAERADPKNPSERDPSAPPRDPEQR
jgi:hypothetical protein